MTVLRAGCSRSESFLGCSGFRHGVARLHHGADWRKRKEAEQSGDRRAIINLAPIVRNPTLWQIDMGDGTWAVSCRPCRLSYRGPKAEADLLFDTHLCEPVAPLQEPTR
jgi:hypothetical protein